MDPKLVDQDSLSTKAIWKQPSEQFFLPNDVQRAQERSEAEEQIHTALAAGEKGYTTATIITDDDADGLGAYAVLDSVYDEVALLPSGPHGTLDTATALSIIADQSPTDMDVWLTDIRLGATDTDAVLSELARLPEDASVIWIDHHIWDDDARTKIESVIQDMVIDAGDDVPKVDERGAAEITADYVETTLGEQLPSQIREAVEVTSVYDCWKKTDDDEFIDPRAKDLGEYAGIVDDPEHYRDALVAHGADISTEKSISAVLEEYRTRNSELNDLAVEESEFVVISESSGEILRVSPFNYERLQKEGVDDDEWVIATTYGTCDQNMVADMLAEKGADSAAIVKPTGGVSFRSRGKFDQCDQVAACFDGGGHETAAGAHIADGKFGIDLDSMAAYGAHWTSHGRDARRAIRHAYKEIITR